MPGLLLILVQPFLARMLGIAAPAGDGRPEDSLAVTGD